MGERGRLGASFGAYDEPQRTLADIVLAWPQLPTEIRAAMIALVRATLASNDRPGGARE